MTREEFFYQCMYIIEHWLNGNRKLSDLREVTDRLYNEVTRPHWISVDEESEPPKEHEWIIGFSLKRSYVDIYNFDSNGLFEAHGITHWMHFSPPAIISNSEKTGKNHLIDANNMVDHFRETTKMIEKGGEE